MTGVSMAVSMVYMMADRLVRPLDVKMVARTVERWAEKTVDATAETKAGEKVASMAAR